MKEKLGNWWLYAGTLVALLVKSKSNKDKFGSQWLIKSKFMIEAWEPVALCMHWCSASHHI